MTHDLWQFTALMLLLAILYLTSLLVLTYL